MNTHDASPDELLKKATKMQLVREVVRLRGERNRLLAAVKAHKDLWQGDDEASKVGIYGAFYREDQKLYKMAKELEEEATT